MTGISTLSMSGMSSRTLMKLQADQKQAYQETINQRYSDVGLELGRLTGTSVSYRVLESSVDAQLEINKVVDGRLDQAQDIMDAVRAAGENLQKSLLSAEKYSDYATLGTSALSQFQGALNTSVGGVYVFGGENAAVAPLSTDTAAGRVKADFNAYLTAINKTPATMTADDMTNYFSDAGVTVGATTYRYRDPAANWSDWSVASSNETSASISRSETVQTSVSSNADALKKVASAYVMLSQMATADLNDAARKVLTQKAATTLKQGTDGVIQISAEVGNRQARVKEATTALTKQKDIVNAAFTDLEKVDQTEAGLRLTQLQTTLQIAMSVTGKLQSLNIFNYL